MEQVIEPTEAPGCHSFGAYHSILVKISNNLKEFTECQKYKYGKHAIFFLAGDFCQLEAIGGDCIYKNRNGICWEQALTCLVELKGTHHFNDCNDMKMIMPNTISVQDNKLWSAVVHSDPDLALAHRTIWIKGPSRAGWLKEHAAFGKKIKCDATT
jgi:hypothetical protein